jgi:N-methylhydantoinase A
MPVDDTEKKGFRLGVDVGGTFTDIILLDPDGHIYYSKTPSTPKDQSLGVLNGIGKILGLKGIEPEAVDQIVHGTTVATNALLERGGSRTGLLTTKGFKDVLNIGRQSRPELYSLRSKKPAPLVDRNHIFEIAERMTYKGEALRPLDDMEVTASIELLNREQLESVAVCFLHAYANAAHEERVKMLIQKHAPHIQVCISSELSREFREYERLNATVVNAYVAKSMDRYISGIATELKEMGIKPPLSIMQSNGGFMSERMARERSVATLLSGPAAGVLATCFMGRLCGYENIISADMGGTSFDISLIKDGEPTMVTESIVGDFPVKLPVVDIHTIGAGGGSIGWIDSGGMLQVGPQSAGADPGPICYRKGGVKPTVTDANLLLQRLNPDAFKGYGIRMDPGSAQKVVLEKIASPLGLPSEEACEGILTVVNAGMVRGIRVVSVEKGYDPRDFTLFAFGGAGPLHAGAIARSLKMKRVVIPVAPGNFSTLGLLTGDMKYNYVRTCVSSEASLDYAVINTLFSEMETDARARMETEGFSSKSTILQRNADIRYLGQSYELTVLVNPGKFDEKSFSQTKERFHVSHRQAYGFSRDDDSVEVVNLRLTSVGKTPPLELKKNKETVGGPEAAMTGTRSVYFDGTWLDAKIFNRDALTVGAVISGPAVIEETGSTTLIFPDDTASIDGYGNICIEISE